MFDLIVSFLSKLGLGGLLAGVYVEAMGLPFPGGIMVIITGILIEQGKLDFLSAFVVTFSGYSAGAITAYIIGKRLGQPFFMRCSKFLQLSPERFEKAQTWLDRSAPVFIIFGRFIPGISNLTPYMAGVSHIGFWYFFFYNSLFTAGWGFLYLMVGKFFGYNYQVVARYLNSKLPLVGLALLLLYFIYIYVKKQLKNKVKNL
ncbi:MAG: DedA family protein [Desulfotomaculaceae bacterium]|nr:DedA family protein [Desulfotomaculaceae bacterium]